MNIHARTVTKVDRVVVFIVIPYAEPVIRSQECRIVIEGLLYCTRIGLVIFQPYKGLRTSSTLQGPKSLKQRLQVAGSQSVTSGGRQRQFAVSVIRVSQPRRCPGPRAATGAADSDRLRRSGRRPFPTFIFSCVSLCVFAPLRFLLSWVPAACPPPLPNLRHTPRRGVLKDQTRLDVIDLGTGGERIQRKVPEVVRILDGDVDEIVV